MQLISKLIHNSFSQVCPLLKEVTMELIRKFIQNTFWQICLLLKEVTMQLIRKLTQNNLSHICLLIKVTMQLIIKFSCLFHCYCIVLFYKLEIQMWRTKHWAWSCSPWNFNLRICPSAPFISSVRNHRAELYT